MSDPIDQIVFYRDYKNRRWWFRRNWMWSPEFTFSMGRVGGASEIRVTSTTEATYRRMKKQMLFIWGLTKES